MILIAMGRRGRHHYRLYCTHRRHPIIMVAICFVFIHILLFIPKPETLNSKTENLKPRLSSSCLQLGDPRPTTSTLGWVVRQQIRFGVQGFGV